MVVLEVFIVMVPVTQAVNAQIKVDKQLDLVPQGISFFLKSKVDE